MSRRREVIISSAAGFSYLLAYGVVWLSAGTISLVLEARTAALVYLLYALPVIPIALLMQRLLDMPVLSAANPLRSLLLVLTLLPLATLPIAYYYWLNNPAQVPLINAAIFALHLFPFAWLMRSAVYTYLAAFVLIVTAVLALLAGPYGFHALGICIGIATLWASQIAKSHARAMASRAND